MVCIGRHSGQLVERFLRGESNKGEAGKADF